MARSKQNLNRRRRKRVPVEHNPVEVASTTATTTPPLSTTTSNDDSATAKVIGDTTNVNSGIADTTKNPESASDVNVEMADVNDAKDDNKTTTDISSTKRKRVKEEVKKSTLSSKYGEIRFGALEILAVFCGTTTDDDNSKEKEDDQEEEGSSTKPPLKEKEEKPSDVPVPYSFVKLASDVLYGDDVTDTIPIQWIEYNSNGKLAILDDDTDSIAIGAIIGSITNDIVEYADGTFEVPNEVIKQIEAALEKQLNDEYDMDKEQEEEATYEQRMKKRRKKAKKGIKVKMEDSQHDYDEVNEDNDDDNDEDAKPTKKKKSKQTKKKATAKTKKSRKTNALQPKTNFPQASNPWTQKTGKIDSFHSDTHRASKEMIRAYLSKDKKAIQAILKDKKVVADIFCAQSVDVPLSVLEYSIVREDKATVALLWKELDKHFAYLIPSTVALLWKELDKQNADRPSFPECTLEQGSSGRHTSRHGSYHTHRNVGATRGGKEGNDAFVDDLPYSHNEQSELYKRTDQYDQDENKLWQLLSNHDPISPSFLDWMDKDLYNGNLFGYGAKFHLLIKNGYQELAQHVMKIMLDKEVGLNKLHIQSLGDGSEPLEKFRAVSVEKLTNADRLRFCPIHCAAINPNPKIIEQLLAVCPQAINREDSEEATVLHYAAVGSKPDTLAYILAEDGPGSHLPRDQKMRKGDKSTPLHWAVRAARPENVRVLCEGKGNDLFQTKNVHGYTALHICAQSYKEARIDTAKALFECGADPNVHGDTKLLNKQTPLMLCAARGDLDLLEVMVENGGNLALTDKHDKTPLMLAAKNGHAHVVSYLIAKGVAADAKDSSDNTAVHYAVAYGFSDCVKLLRDAGAPLDEKNIWSLSTLEVALKKGRYACAVYLLKENVNVNVLDKNGVSLFTSLVTSCMGKLANEKNMPLPWPMKKMLEREELDVTLSDNSGQTVLHSICNGCSTSEGSLSDLVDELLKRGADPLKKNKAGQVAAELALKNKNIPLCLKLLKHSDHSDIYEGSNEGCWNLMHHLMSNIDTAEHDLFFELFAAISSCNSTWIKHVNNDGATPLFNAFKTLRCGSWNKDTTKGDSVKIIDTLLKKVPKEVIIETGRLSRKAKYRSWNKEIHLDEKGLPNWNPEDEYQCGSRNILHEVLQCRDAKWADQTSLKILKLLDNESKEIMLHEKTNDGKDAISFVMETFVHSECAVQPVLKLLQLLCDHGAPMNSVCHPLFSSLSDAQDDIAEVRFDGDDEMDCLENAFKFVRTKAQLECKKLLEDEEKKQSVKSLFRPRVLDLMQKHKSPVNLLNSLMRKCGLDASIKDVDGNTAIHLINDLSYYKVLIPFSDVNAVNNKGETALILFAAQIDIVKLLIESGCDVDISARQGTALHVAVMKGKSDVVELLLKTCDVNATDCQQRTALHHAISTGATSRQEMLNPIENQLILAGANVNAVDKYGRCPMHYAFFPARIDPLCRFPPADSRDPIKMVTLLADRPEIDLSVADKDQRTPLHYAASVGASICVLYLCENSKESIGAKDLDDNTPLALALRAKKANTTILLMSKNSDIRVSVTDITRVRSGSSSAETRNADNSTSRWSKEGWTRVRHAIKGQGGWYGSSYWHQSNDQLTGTDVYGNPSDDNRYWSVDFNKAVPEFDEFLFSTGDCQKWLIATKDSVIGEHYNNSERTVTESSTSAKPYAPKWHRSPGNMWISLAGHDDYDVDSNMLYGEGSQSGYSKVLNNHDGADVYIRNSSMCPELDGQVKETNKQVESALCTALMAGDECESVARYMLASGKLSMKTIITALFRTNHFQLAMEQIKLCPYKEKIVNLDKENKMNALHYLAQVKSFDSAPAFVPALVDALVVVGTNVSAQDSKSRTALHIAAYHGHLHLAKHLISIEASVDTEDAERRTPFLSMFDGSKQSIELLTTLLDASKDLNRSINGTVSGNYDTKSEDDWVKKLGVETYLLDSPKDRRHSKEAIIEKYQTQNKKDTQKPPQCTVKSIQSTPLIECVKMNNTDLVNSLFSYGVDGSLKDENGRNALHHAVLLQNANMLSRILMWDSIPLNELDRFGRSALTYAFLFALDSSSFELINMLLEYGADPLVGGILEFAVQLNEQSTVETILYHSQRVVEKADAECTRKTKYKKGEWVWVRYGSSTSWKSATIYSVGEYLAVVPGRQDNISNISQHCSVIGNLPFEAVCHLNKKIDILNNDMEEQLSKLFTNTKLRDDEKRKMLNDHDFSGTYLESQLRPSLKRDAIFSTLSIGHLVGVVEGDDRMDVGEVIECGQMLQYNVQLLSGSVVKNIPRSKLRPLRDELKIVTIATKPNLASNLVHLCIQPVKYGSYENISLLRALIEKGGLPADSIVDGKVPLDLARPGSEIYNYLCDVTNSMKEEYVPPENERVLPCLGDFDLETDADAEQSALYEEVSKDSEPIIPDVSNLCDVNSAGLKVLPDGEEFYDCALTKVDVGKGQDGKFVFYKMQIIADPIRKNYVLLTNWGQIGDYGKKQQTPFNTAEDAIKEFSKVFKSKTGNHWIQRASFNRISGKYLLIKTPTRRLKHPEKLLGSVVEESRHPCSLPDPLADAFRFLLDVDFLTSAYSAWVNNEQLPFGQLSLSTIQQAESKLDEIKKKVSIKDEARNKSPAEFRTALDDLAKASSDFYELFPIGGDRIVKPFDSVKGHDFTSAIQAIQVSRDLTVTRQLLFGAKHRQEFMNPIDYIYNAIGVNITPLDEKSIERKCLLRHIDNTYEGGGQVINQIYALDDGKDPCNDIPNKRLLFHGSDNRNILGILKKGLLITPPEAQLCGSSYGKGVYFGDKFSTSLNYINPYGSKHGEQPRSFMFVAEVAVGSSYIPAGCCSDMVKAKDGYHSTLALGSQEPNKSRDFTLNTGERFSLGELTNTTQESTVCQWSVGGRYQNSPLPEEENQKIEALRADPNTTFPVDIPITYNDKKQVVTLLGPTSKVAKMKPVAEPTEDGTSKDSAEKKMDVDKEEDGEDEDMDEDLPLLHFSFGLVGSNKEGPTEVDLYLNKTVNGSRGGNSEFIVYDPKQIRLKYLIEMTTESYIRGQYEVESKEKNANVAEDECEESDEESDDEEDSMMSDE